MHKKGKWVEWSWCGETKWVFAQRLKIKKDHFCNRECFHEFKKGKTMRSDNPNWRGGRSVIAGRPVVYVPNHSRSTKEGYVYEHLLIAEKVIRRPLKFIRHAHMENEIGHHIDKDKGNNSNDNLLICTELYHRGLHGRMKTMGASAC